MLDSLFKETFPPSFVFKYLFYSTVLLVLRQSGVKGGHCTEISRWISRLAVFLEDSSLHAENNGVWTIIVLIPGPVHRDFKPMICRSLCFSLQLKTSHKFISISTVSGFHLTIYSPLHFIFSFWHFQNESSACHFKLFFQPKFNFKISRKQKGTFVWGFFLNQWRFVGCFREKKKRERERRGRGKKEAQMTFVSPLFFPFLSTQILLLAKL